jgi:hypothetical protein
LSLTSADKQNGITGFVEDKLTGARINFESRTIGGQLVSQIKNKDGYTLVEYIESQQEVVYPTPDSPPSLAWVPWLRVNGIEYNGYESDVVEEMKAIVSADNGELIRQLAIYLVLQVPGKDLEAERRALEVPYQAFQRFYDRSYRKTGLETETSSHNEAPSGESLVAKRKVGDDVILLPDGCKMPNCKFVDTSDYQLTDKGGFVVRSLSPRITLSHNYAGPGHTHDNDSEGITPMDDESQVGNCFGRCGRACGDWTHEWISRTEFDYTYCQDVQFPNDMPIDCSWMCCSEERREVGASGIAVHTAHGHVTLSSIAHDACCRNLFWGCWNPVCIALFPATVDCLIPGLGWDETWSYVGPLSEYYNYATGVCCN